MGNNEAELDRELKEDYKRSYRAWRTGDQREFPGGLDFPDLSEEEIKALIAEVDEEFRG